MNEKTFALVAVFIFVVVVVLAAENANSAMIVVSIVASFVAMYTQLVLLSQKEKFSAGEENLPPVRRPISSTETESDLTDSTVDQTNSIEYYENEPQELSEDEIQEELKQIDVNDRRKEDKKNTLAANRPNVPSRTIDNQIKDFLVGRNLDRDAKRGAQSKTVNDFRANLEPTLEEHSKREWWGNSEK